jgi:hypothetical protein
MRIAALATSLIALALPSLASAALITTIERTPITSGPGTGYDRVVLYAYNERSPVNLSVDPVNGGGQLLGADITVRAAAPNTLRFDVADTNFDFIPDRAILDLTPLTTAPLHLQNAFGTRYNDKLFLTLAPGFPRGANGSSPPAVIDSSFQLPVTSGSVYLANLTVFRIAGFDSSPVPPAVTVDDRGTTATASMNGGKGLPIVTAVVLSGTPVSFAGIIGDEFGTQHAIPEPATLTVLAAGLVPMLRRRRR